MRAPPGPTLLTTLIGVLGLYIWMALRSGCVWLFFPTLQILTRKERPVGYWLVIAAAALVLASSVGFMTYEAIRKWPDGFFEVYMNTTGYRNALGTSRFVDISRRNGSQAQHRPD